MRAFLVVSLVAMGCSANRGPVRLGDGVTDVDGSPPPDGWGEDPAPTNNGGLDETDTGAASETDTDTDPVGGNGGGNGGNGTNGGTGLPPLPGTGYGAYLDTDSNGEVDTAVLALLQRLYDTDSDGVLDSTFGTGQPAPATARPGLPPIVVLAGQPLVVTSLYASSSTFP